MDEELIGTKIDHMGTTLEDEGRKDFVGRGFRMGDFPIEGHTKQICQIYVGEL